MPWRQVHHLKQGTESTYCSCSYKVRTNGTVSIGEPLLQNLWPSQPHEIIVAYVGMTVDFN